MRHFICLALLATSVSFALAAAPGEDQRKAGDALLTQGDLPGALERYHAACAAGPSDYQNFYKRATVYLAMGRTRQAIKDFDEILKLKPDLATARSRRAELLLKQGSLDKAKEDYQKLSDEESKEKLQQIELVAHLLTSGDEKKAAGDFQGALTDYTHAVDICPNDPALRLKRAGCYRQLNALGEAVGDVMRCSKLSTDNADAYDLLSHLFYQMGERQDALTQIRECVKLDDDHPCKKFYRKLKKFNKAFDKLQAALDAANFDEALERISLVRDVESTEPVYVAQLQGIECRCKAKLGRGEEALEACGKAIELSPDDIDLYMLRGEVHEHMSNFEDSIKDYQAAVERDENNRQAKERLARAQKLLKNSLKRDYYKILGVPRNARKKEVVKAYRKLAQEWHPDKFESAEDKAKAEKKFMDIAAAKEVLTDPEKRQMFDNGEDPLDPEEERERQSHRANPFGHGFNPFGGRGGNGQQFFFKFQ